MRMEQPIGRLSSSGKLWLGAAFGNGSRKADLCRTSIVSNDGFRKNWEPPESAVTYRSVGAIWPAASCALPTSEKAGNLIVKRPSWEFSLGVATAQVSAEAAVQHPTRLRP